MTRAPKLDSVRIVDRAKKYIARGWAQYNYALNREGLSVDPMWPEACCFCLEGALFRARKDLHLNPLENPLAGDFSEDLMGALAAELDTAPMYLPLYNDEVCKSQEEAIAFLNRVRERLKAA